MTDNEVGFEVILQVDWKNHPLLARLDHGSSPDGDWHFCLFGLSASEASEAKRLRLQYREQSGWKDSIAGSGEFFPSRGWQASSADWFCVEINPHALEWRALIPTSRLET